MTPLDGKAVASTSVSEDVPAAASAATALVGAVALTPHPASGFAAIREHDSPTKCGGEAMVQIPVSAWVSAMLFLPARMAKGVLALQLLLSSYPVTTAATSSPRRGVSSTPFWPAPTTTVSSGTPVVPTGTNWTSSP